MAAQRQRICRESRKGRSSLLKHGKKTFLIPINLKLTMNLLSLIAWQARDLSVQ
jgi:hypothetical protein